MIENLSFFYKLYIFCGIIITLHYYYVCFTMSEEEKKEYYTSVCKTEAPNIWNQLVLISKEIIFNFILWPLLFVVIVYKIINKSK